MLRTTSATVALLTVLIAACAASSENLPALTCEEGKITALNELRTGDGYSMAFYSTTLDQEFWGTITVMVTSYNRDGFPITRLPPSSQDDTSRTTAMLDNYESVVLEDMLLFETAERSELTFNGRQYVGFEGQALEQNRKSVVHVRAYEDFAKIAFVTNEDDESFDFLLKVLDDAVEHCRLPRM